ncbi:MAG: IS607 family transposase, partial [Okeania sp. SIO3I5]|uniref:IS607 family transposase n=1 Tax=Okeania sp. SIO3I5 TaxID=2607805 RepID=UPI0013BB1113
VAVSSLRRWDEVGKIKAIKTPSGHRRYSIAEIEQAGGLPRAITTVCYARVSSHSQRDDIERQIELLLSRFPEAEIVSEVGSGLNFKRKGFLSILDRICTGDIKRLVVAHPDRLVRFGFELVKWLCERNECQLLVQGDSKQSPEPELVQDMLSIIHCFSSRLYGLRRYKKEISEKIREKPVQKKSKSSAK